MNTINVSAATYWKAEVLNALTGSVQVYESKNTICYGAESILYNPTTAFIADVGRVWVGRGVTPPTSSNTRLEDPVTYVDVDIYASTLVPTPVVDGMTQIVMVGVLPVGLDIGRIGECGLATTTKFWSRNVFRDQNGRQITLVKDANSQITLTATVKLYSSGSQDVGTNAVSGWNGLLLNSGLQGLFTESISSLRNGMAGDSTADLSVENTGIIGTQIGNTSTGLATRLSDTEIQFTIGAGTWTGLIREIVPTGDAGKFRYVFTPGITKAAGDVAVYRINYSLERI